MPLGPNKRGRGNMGEGNPRRCFLWRLGEGIRKLLGPKTHSMQELPRQSQETWRSSPSRSPPRCWKVGRLALPAGNPPLRPHLVPQRPLDRAHHHVLVLWRGDGLLFHQHLHLSRRVSSCPSHLHAFANDLNYAASSLSSGTDWS
jgi:hypothetical protein